MITGASNGDNKQPVSAEERAARYSQKATAIALTGITSKETPINWKENCLIMVMQRTVLETQNTSLILAIKNAGLVCLCVNYSTDLADIDLIPTNSLLMIFTVC